MSELARDPFVDAAAQGLEAVLPDEDELFIDIDDDDSEIHMHSMLAVLRDNGYHCEITKITTSKSGNKHIYIKGPKTVDPTQRIALQACLGSDRKREILSFLRTYGNSHPTVFFEVPAKQITACSTNKYVSHVSTPYATDCISCGTVYMTEEFYTRQMNAPDSLWRCAKCGQVASWNDDIYEKYLEEMESKV